MREWMFRGPMCAALLTAGTAACGAVAGSNPDASFDAAGETPDASPDGGVDSGVDGGVDAALPGDAVGGTVTGLSGAGLQLQLGAETLPVSANGVYAFTTPFDRGASYQVAVATQPDGQTCVVSNASGIFAGVDVGDVDVSCYTVVFVVNLTGDASAASVGSGTCAAIGGGCTLRAAVQEANVTQAPVLIRVPAATITLNSPFGGSDDADAATKDLDIAGGREVHIVGVSAASSIISGGNTTRIFHSLAGAKLVLEHVTVADGDSGGFGGYAARVDATGELTLRDTVVRAHHATINGGAINTDGIVTIVRTRFTDNRAANGVLYNNGTLHIRDSVFDANETTFRGGALYHEDGELVVLNSTFSGNTSNTDGAFDGGGALEVAGGTATLQHVTITNNRSTMGAGGGILVDPGVSVTVQSSIIAGNNATAGRDCSGALTSAGGNILGVSDGCTMALATGDLAGTAAAPVAPGLGNLANVAGTFGHEPQATSPALGAAVPGACPTHDQAGRLRPANKDDCDSGAIEAQ